MRKTKIVCTLGPATDSDEVLKKLIQKGMDVARFNFSHGTYENHEERLRKLLTMEKEEQRLVATLLDTKGPEIRLKQLEGGKILLKEGQNFILHCEKEILGTCEGASITYPNLYKDVSVGTKILIDDGLIEMKVSAINDKDIVCTVLNEGTISNSKGINVPNTSISMEYISAKDKEDILFGIEHDFDFIAASFVRTKEDIMEIKSIFRERNATPIPIIAKIENRQGIEHIDGILEEADGIMVARGDMGVEIPYEEVPVLQKELIAKAKEAGKIVITATQMLDSMMQHPRPTRAEANDVANAIYDGTEAIMLSGETAAGLYPVEALEAMVKIACKAEACIDYQKLFFQNAHKYNPNVTDAICHATCTTAYNLDAKAIVTVTTSGNSARNIAKYRPAIPIIACTTNTKVCRQLGLSFGIYPIYLEEKNEIFELYNGAIEAACKKNMLEKEDLVVLTAGIPLGRSGTTNMIKVQTVS